MTQRTKMKGIINTVILLCVLFQFGQLHSQRVIDTFLIEDLTGGWVNAEVDYKLHEDSDHFYYMVEKPMFDVERKVVNGEIVTFLTKNQCKYEVQGNLIEDSAMPSIVDTLGGGYILLLKFTKDFELVDYTILKNIQYEISNNIQDLKIENGKIYLIGWTGQDYPVMVNDREFATGLNTTVNGESMNCLIVLNEELEAESVNYFPQIILKGAIPNKSGEVILGCQIPNNEYNKVIIGKDTIKNNLFDGQSYPISFENVVLCNYNYNLDSILWWELISNDLGVRIIEIIEGPHGFLHLHLTAASPYVYVGPEDAETDSVKVFGTAVPWLPEQRDHLMLKFDNNGYLHSSLTIPEGIYDNWHNFIVNNDGDIFISAAYVGEELSIRDTIFKNNYKIDNPSSFSYRDGILKFSKDGSLDWGFYPRGDYSHNSIYEMRLQESGLYAMGALNGENIIIEDTVLSGGVEKQKHFLIRMSEDGKTKEIVYSGDAPLDAIIDVREISKDTLVLIPYITPENWIYDYQWNPYDGLGLLKVDFSEKDVSNNTTFIVELPEVRVYPNPIHTGSELTIEFEEKIHIEGLIIYNMEGRPVAEKSISGYVDYQVRIPDIPPGQYYIKCMLESGILIKPLIIQ